VTSAISSSAEAKRSSSVAACFWPARKATGARILTKQARAKAGTAGPAWRRLPGTVRRVNVLRLGSLGRTSGAAGLPSACPAGHRCTVLTVGWKPPCGACEARGDAAEHGREKLTDPIPRRKKSRRPLETFLGLPNFFGVATAAIGTPSGSRD